MKRDENATRTFSGCGPKVKRKTQISLPGKPSNGSARACSLSCIAFTGLFLHYLHQI